MKILFFLLLLCEGASLQAQDYNSSIGNLIKASENYSQVHRTERLYLQMDKATYQLNDTLWFKTYLFDGATLRPSKQSNIVYIEISNEKNTLVARRIIQLNYGLGWGSIALSKDNFPQGGYTLRAYTNWQRNFDESYIFKKQFYIYDLNRNNWLITYKPTYQNRKVGIHLQLSELDRKPVMDQQVQASVKQGEKTLEWDKIMHTSVSGGLDLDILPPQGNQLPVYATLQKAKANGPDINAFAYKFPLPVNRPEKTDLQFMPESGNMVAGIATKVGFKAISEDGKGVDISGKLIKANTNEVLASFSSLYKGMGSFELKPEAGTAYEAIIELPGGVAKKYKLPEVKTAGTVLTVSNSLASDSVIIKIGSTVNDGKYILTGQSRGLMCFVAKVSMSGKSAVIVKAPKSAFASGVTRFCLLNEQLSTLNERIIYIDHNNNLQIAIKPNKPFYLPQDSIALQIEVKDDKGEPVQGTFSMSVVSNLQLTTGKDDANIATHLLLASDLKGDIETPSYYCGSDTGQFRALDNLMLTQGWTGFDWKNLFQPEKPPVFAAEKTLDVGGQVTGLFGKVKDVNVDLISLRPLIVDKVQTDENGNFKFIGLPVLDS